MEKTDHAVDLVEVRPEGSEHHHLTELKVNELWVTKGNSSWKLVKEVTQAATDKFTKLAGKNCDHDGTDLLRDFVGAAEQCAEKAIEIGAETFIRVNAGHSSHVGKCYFRGGS